MVIKYINTFKLALIITGLIFAGTYAPIETPFESIDQVEAYLSRVAGRVPAMVEEVIQMKADYEAKVALLDQREAMLNQKVAELALVKEKDEEIRKVLKLRTQEVEKVKELHILKEAEFDQRLARVNTLLQQVQARPQTNHKALQFCLFSTYAGLSGLNYMFTGKPIGGTWLNQGLLYIAANGLLYGSMEIAKRIFAPAEDIAEPEPDAEEYQPLPG